MTAAELYMVKYLKEHGIDSSNFDEKAKLLDDVVDLPEFTLVKLGKEEFFKDLAKKLRALWPPGEKEGKWPWRDSVKNLSNRLEFLWRDRRLEGYTVDDVLIVARRYLSRFQESTKYMMLLKYFITKQKSIESSDGKRVFVQESVLADMLEGKSELDAVENEWASLVESDSAGEGDLV